MLRFGIDDEDAFGDAKERLLDEFSRWLGDDDPDGELAADAELLLDWRWGYSTGVLDRFDAADLDEYLLEWCPRKVSSPPDGWMPIAEAARRWVSFLEATGRWRGGPPAALQRAMEAFNALPDEERRALLDPLVERLGGPPPVLDVPLTAGADPEVAAAEAAAAPILSQVAAVREFLGDGRALTAKGNPKVADARHLAELLDTDDLVDYRIGDREHRLRSADELPHLQFLLDAMVEVGSIERTDRNRLAPVPGWDERPPLDRVRDLFAAMTDLGPVSGRASGFDRATDELLEDGLIHWLIAALVAGEVEFDDVVAQSLEVVEDQLGPRWFSDRRDLAWSVVADDVGRALDVAERCGLVRRHGDHLEEDRWGLRPRRRGGTVTITELGRLLVGEFAADAGYRVPVVADLRNATADEVVRQLGSAVDLDPAEMWRVWAPDRAEADRVAELVEVFATTGSPADRLTAMGLLAQTPAAAGAALRPLLDGPLGGHVAAFLMEQNGVDPDDLPPLGPAAALQPLVDLLAVELDAGDDQLVEHFDELVPPDGRTEILEVLWRVDQPETAAVLEALGRRHPDRAVAKAARKAAFRHHSAYPGR
jgi:hypothetical protein